MRPPTDAFAAPAAIAPARGTEATRWRRFLPRGKPRKAAPPRGWPRARLGPGGRTKRPREGRWRGRLPRTPQATATERKERALRPRPGGWPPQVRLWRRRSGGTPRSTRGSARRGPTSRRQAPGPRAGRRRDRQPARRVRRPGSRRRATPRLRGPRRWQTQGADRRLLRAAPARLIQRGGASRGPGAR